VVLVVAGLLAPMAGRATTLPPELKAYDFAEAYYLEDGGVVIAPYHHGFYCEDGIQTPEGIRIMPGGSFLQYDASRMVVDEFKLLKLNPEGTRAYFHQWTYRYKTEKDANGHWQYIRQELLATNSFYLTKTRILQWFDFAFPGVEIHPGAEGWRSRPQYFGR
jgi:hypothetical protein